MSAGVLVKLSMNQMIRGLCCWKQLILEVFFDVFSFPVINSDGF